jgi:hypothetical protein
MNEIIRSQTTQPLPATVEADNIARAAEQDAGFEKLLKFKKGAYSCDGEDVKIGTQYVAHCVGWTKCWIKFVDGQVADQRMYRVADGKEPPQRDELDAKEMIGVKDPKSGLSIDPWVYQHLLPLESEAGDLVVFVTSSMGGRRAVADLCKQYARRAARTKIAAQPVIKLAVGIMPSKMFGDVPRPNFEIVGWDEHKEGIRTVKGPDTLKDEMEDEIPFN